MGDIIPGTVTAGNLGGRDRSSAMSEGVQAGDWPCPRGDLRARSPDRPRAGLALAIRLGFGAGRRVGGEQEDMVAGV